MAGFLAGSIAAERADAQSPAPAPAAAPGSAKLVASWTGNFTTDGPSGTMTLTISKEGSDWKVVNSLGESVPPPGDVREVQATGDKITWKQVFGEYDVAFTATLSADGAQLSGTLEATQGGSVVGGGSFTLTKK